MSGSPTSPRRAGEHRSVHYHFSGRDEILTEALRYAIQQAFDRNREALRGLGDARERLARLIDLQLPRDPEVRGEWLVWLEFWPRRRAGPSWPPCIASCTPAGAS